MSMMSGGRVDDVDGTGFAETLGTVDTLGSGFGSEADVVVGGFGAVIVGGGFGAVTVALTDAVGSSGCSTGFGFFFFGASGSVVVALGALDAGALGPDDVA
jgi:hypothetical protein